jgi:hypothetical protein
MPLCCTIYAIYRRQITSGIKRAHSYRKPHCHFTFFPVKTTNNSNVALQIHFHSWIRSQLLPHIESSRIILIIPLSQIPTQMNNAYITFNIRDFHTTCMLAVCKLGTENFMRQTLDVTNLKCFPLHSVAWILTCCSAQWFRFRLEMQYSAYSQKFKQTTHLLSHSLTQTNYLPIYLIAKLEFKWRKTLFVLYFKALEVLYAEHNRRED